MTEPQQRQGPPESEENVCLRMMLRMYGRWCTSVLYTDICLYLLYQCTVQYCTILHSRQYSSYCILVILVSNYNPSIKRACLFHKI